MTPVTTLDGGPIADESRSVSQGFRLTAALLLALLAVTGISQYTFAAGSGWGARLRVTDQFVWPQQWAFFARESDAHLLAAYRITAGGSLVPESEPQTSARNRWGLGSESSAQSIELHTIAGKVPAASWVDCAGMTASTCAANAKPTTMANALQPALLCGPTVLVRSTNTMAVVRITCADG